MLFLNTTCLPPTWRNISKEQALNEYQKSQSQITILHELKIASLLSCCFCLCNALHKTTFILLLRFVNVANTLLILTSSMKMFTRLLRSGAVYFTAECFTPQVGKILPIQVVLRLTIYVLCSRKFKDNV